MNKKKTTKKVVKLASNELKKKYITKVELSNAGSALSQYNTNKETSKKVAKGASKILRDKKKMTKSKKVAGSVLSQA